MKLLLTVLIALFLVGFMWAHPDLMNRIFGSKTPEPTPAPLVLATPATKARPRVTYVHLLEPAYSRLIRNTETLQSNGNLASDLPRLRTILAPLPVCPEREASLKICSLIEQAAAVTHEERARYRAASPRSSEHPHTAVEMARAQSEDREKDAFFRQAVERDWTLKMEQIQAAARLEWEKITPAASFEGTAPLLATPRGYTVGQ